MIEKILIGIPKVGHALWVKFSGTPIRKEARYLLERYSEEEVRYIQTLADSIEASVKTKI